MKQTIITAENIVKRYRAFEGLFKGSETIVNAVDDISLEISKGRSLGIVGESGSGKTTLSKIISDIIKPDSGSVKYYGQDITDLGNLYMQYRKNVQVVFQDPYLSLNPKLTIHSAMKDAFKVHNIKGSPKELCGKYLEMVGLEKKHMYRYPHEFSGGQRQRISIARALSLEPEIIIADEPVSSLDVSVQAQILNLMKKLKLENNVTFILISHDLAVVSFLCDDVLVMHDGKMVEYGTVQKVLTSPEKDYTRKLLAASGGEIC
jgi:ABC-type oligopeptide transport system ATPase subunit